MKKYLLVFFILTFCIKCYANEKFEFENFFNDFSLVPIERLSGGELFGVVEVYIKNAKYNQAIELAEKMIKEYPDIAQGYILLAKAKSKSGDTKDLEKIYTTCIEKCPKDARAYIYRAIIRHNQKRYKDAIEDYTTALKLDDASWYKYNLYENRAVAKYFDGNLYSALIDYNKAISLKEETSDRQNIDQFYFNRGLCRYDVGDIIGANEDYIKAVTLNPASNYVYYNVKAE